jgi:hypothetical protein
MYLARVDFKSNFGLNTDFLYILISLRRDNRVLPCLKNNAENSIFENK